MPNLRHIETRTYAEHGELDIAFAGSVDIWWDTARHTFVVKNHRYRTLEHAQRAADMTLGPADSMELLYVTRSCAA